MRLIDADNMKFSNGINEDGLLYVPFRDIQEQPTTYDVDKIVEKLEEKIADMNFCEYRDAFIDAIEIVKQGSIGKDVE